MDARRVVLLPLWLAVTPLLGCALVEPHKMAWRPPATSDSDSNTEGGGDSDNDGATTPLASMTPLDVVQTAPLTASAAQATRSRPSAVGGALGEDYGETSGGRDDALLSRIEPATRTSPAGEHAVVFTWPLVALGVNSPFGERTDPFDGKRRFHGGVDLDAAYGAFVRATADGVVSHSGFAHGHGRQVVIEHSGGFRSGYSHLAQLFVEAGQEVRTGQLIGRLGNSGRSTGPHLHFELGRYGELLDPLDLLGQSITTD